MQGYQATRDVTLGVFKHQLPWATIPGLITEPIALSCKMRKRDHLSLQPSIMAFISMLDRLSYPEVDKLSVLRAR
jgi:hypothetical protein